MFLIHTGSFYSQNCSLCFQLHLSVQMDVSTAFNYLRPITVTVTQNHDVKSVQTLSDVLRSDVLSDDVIQQMHEYIAFPLRLLLKNYAVK